jgi:hypothetical protein
MNSSNTRAEPFVLQRPTIGDEPPKKEIKLSDPPG